ncbi:MAG: hypothetical protein ACFN4S_00080 [Prevotella conceptionensis]|jgi:hypothetical protein
MSERKLPPIEGQEIILVAGAKELSPGSAGIKSHLGGQATTISGIAGATGGIDAGNFIEADV